MLPVPFLIGFLGLIQISLGYLSPNLYKNFPTKVFSAKDRLLNIIDGTIEKDSKDGIFACPKTLNDVNKKTRYYGFSAETFFEESDQSSDSTMKYKQFFTPSGETYVDFTINEEQERPLWELTQREIVGQNFFQNPIISGIYERGYRQQFQNAGFPGIEKEWKEIEQYFTTMNASNVMDLSCGSGFMTRKMLSSSFERVICADLSPNMLAETLNNAKSEGLRAPEAIRADSARLPLQCNSLDAIHAGAAMHCWPRLEDALKEIYRVLKPGGVFYSSTFFVNAYSMTSGTNIPGPETNSGFRLFKDEEEIEQLVRDAGFNMAATDNNSNNYDGDDDDDKSNNDSSSSSGNEGGMVIVRKEGRSCAIVKAMKAPFPSGIDVEEAEKIIRFVY